MKVLMTGITGTVGPNLLKSLSKDDEYIFVARDGREKAEDRVKKVLEEFNIDIKYTVIASEINELPIIGKVDDVWHCAASLSYDWDKQEETLDTNYYGTRNLLNKVDCKNFYYISTAYMIGKLTGLTELEKVPKRKIESFNNPYEYSKYVTEEWLLSQKYRFENLKIFRPSIIVGNSIDYSLNKTDGGIYNVTSFFRLLNRRLDKKIKFPVFDTKINLIPIDIAVDFMVEKTSVEKHEKIIYNVVNFENTSVKAIIDTGINVFDLENISTRFVDTQEEFEEMIVKADIEKCEKLFNVFNKYLNYISETKNFITSVKPFELNVYKMLEILKK